MSSAREKMKELLPDSETLKNRVAFPIAFKDISMLQGVSVNDALGGILNLIKEERNIISQYRDPKEKIAGSIFGFYINHSAAQQNILNDKLMEVFEELERVTAEKNELAARLKLLEEKMQASESGS